MRIGILLRILWPAGAPKIAIMEAKELTKLGHDVTLYFLRSSEFGYKYEDLLKDVNYKVISPNHKSLMTPIYSKITRMFAKDRGDESRVDYDLIRKFPSVIKDEKLDYLVCHDQWAGLSCYYAHKKHNIPYSVFIHEKLSNYSLPILGKIATDLERKALFNAEKIFAVTDKVGNTITNKYPELKGKVIPNYPGMELKREIKPYEERENVILAVSMWDRGRKPELYLEIASSLPKYSFMMAGNWRIKELKEEFIEKIKEKGVKNLTLREGLSENELSEMYSKSKFSLRFGFSEYGPAMVVIESLSNGTPVIVNKDLGTAELIKENNAGIVVDDPLDSISAIVENDNEKRYKSMLEGVRRVTEKYSWSAHAKKLLL